ncbi:MAG: hypothetical protein AAFY88_19290 [Acidobacteriota bacterium]
MKDPKPTAGSSVDPSGADLDNLSAPADSPSPAADLEAEAVPESTPDDGTSASVAEDNAQSAQTDDDAPAVDPRTAADLALFLPGGEIALSQARDVMQRGKRAEKARLVSLLLTYAGWDEIWAVADEDDVRKLFGHLDLPPALATAWALFLKI